MARIPMARTMHDLGLAAWFGGSLMGAIGLNGAASNVTDPTQRAGVAVNGWARWAPVNATAIGAHLLGGALIVRENRGRILGQRGVAGWTTAKAVLTAAALGTTAASGYYGAQLAKAGPVPASGATEPSTGTPEHAAAAQQRLAQLQWATPALTAGIVYITAAMGEQQRPAQVLKGTALQLITVATKAAKHPKLTRTLATAAAGRAISSKVKTSAHNNG